MYKSKEQALLNSKNNSLNDIQKQEKQAETDAYGYRNQAASQHAQNVQAARDYMAKNNLLQSGESVDALVRNNTSYTNNIGGINTNLLKQKDEYNNNRNLINKNYNSDLNSYKADVESQRAKALFDYQEQLRQEALAQARAYSSGSGSSGSSESNYTTAPTKLEATTEINTLLNNGQWGAVKNLLDSGVLETQYGKTYANQVRSLYNANHGVEFNTSFNKDRYARQSSMY